MDESVPPLPPEFQLFFLHFNTASSQVFLPRVFTKAFRVTVLTVRLHVASKFTLTAIDPIRIKFKLKHAQDKPQHGPGSPALVS